ncbi:hypothetical protein GCM10011511_46820 [Puia dinghuensis]|uniref:DUF1080 domain-containing protein n=2 Tax=Puia dinghuensis TaxID=1792502 RepID=A0A8J2UHA2_9BACT|nr:hypothetical protein GCM10011511_46820 [Puia dinghuensis]
MLFLVGGMLAWGVAVVAQSKVVTQSKPVPVSLRPEHWTYRPGAVQFDDSAGVARMKVVDGRGYVVLKNVDFGDGTIEFDDIPTDPSFSQIYFRWQDSLEAECFYFRTARGVGHPYAMTGVQYTPIVKGVMMWDALPQYQTFATYQNQTANHVKIVLSGARMRVWVNNMERPTLEVTRMEGNTTHGTLAFAGEAIVSNLVLKPGQVEGLSPVAGPDETEYDPRYLRHWQVGEPDTMQEAMGARVTGLAKREVDWKPMNAERRGFVNLSRTYGGGRQYRSIWLKTTIHAEAARTVQMRLGFLDDVAVFVNDRLVYVDKNYFGTPIAKVPNGRMSLENATFSIPLQAGDNVLMMRVGNNFYTWGIVARLDDLDGLSIER